MLLFLHQEMLALLLLLPIFLLSELHKTQHLLDSYEDLGIQNQFDRKRTNQVRDDNNRQRNQQQK